MVALVYLAIGGIVLVGGELLARREARRTGVALGPCSPLGLMSIVVAWPGFLLALIADLVTTVRARRR
jgi:hypothetical protein